VFLVNGVTFSHLPLSEGGLFAVPGRVFQNPARAVRLGWVAVWLLAALIGAATANGETVAVEDALGRTVNVTRPVRRVVGLNSDVVETLRLLGAGDLLVGVYSDIRREPDFWGELAKLPKVGTWREPNYEAIAKLEPDLILAYGGFPTLELEEKMATLGIGVLRLDFFKIARLEKEVRILGHLLEREPQAERFCEWHARNLAAIRERIPGTGPRPAVYLESYKDYHTAGPGGGEQGMCELACGRNIAASFSIPYPCVSPEWVITQNPDVIIKAAGWGDGSVLHQASRFNAKRDAIMRRPAWHHIRAVAEGRVHVLDSSIWKGPRSVIGVAHMARWFYPELRKELDPEALHREYLEKFQGIEYKGVFVSDPLARNKK